MSKYTEAVYKGYTIRVVPRKEHCSNFGLVILNAKNQEIKHITAAGESEDMALKRGQEYIDFEIAYAQEQDIESP